jgi:hypothetical protein
MTRRLAFEVDKPRADCGRRENALRLKDKVAARTFIPDAIDVRE